MHLRLKYMKNETISSAHPPLMRQHKFKNVLENLFNSFRTFPTDRVFPPLCSRFAIATEKNCSK